MPSLCLKTLLLIAASLGLLMPWAAVHAAHPMQTEDTGTQREGNIELENGLDWSRSGGSRDFAYQPQVSYGLTPATDLIVQPSLLRHRDPTSRLSGWGDTNLDVKWRFFGRAPLSLAVRAGATLATSEDGLGNPHGRTTAHALLAATWDAAPLTVHGNVSLSQNPSGIGLRRTVAGVSAAAMWQLNEQLILTVDGSAAANPDPSRHAWPATLLAGAIYTLRPGLDLDVGWQSSVAATKPAKRDLLAGLTYRFAP